MPRLLYVLLHSIQYIEGVRRWQNLESQGPTPVSFQIDRVACDLSIHELLAGGRPRTSRSICIRSIPECVLA